jgi:YihY family inner membrane protein
MDLLAPIRAFDRFQRRHPSLAIPIAVLRNFSDQEGGSAAALIAYWGFFSIFPLLLVFTTILGFLLQSDHSIEHAVVHSALKQFPIVGSHPAALSGSGVALVIGLAAAIFSGLGITLAAQKAFNRVYAVAHREQPNFLVSRWRGLKLLLVVGVLQVLSTVASGLVSGGLGGPLLTIAGIAISLLLNLALFSVAFRFLTDRSVPTHDLRPGILLATAGWELLQALGGLYVRHVVRGADETYGTFATVIGLLAWLYLGGRIVVYAAEINVVLRHKLWPRSLMDPPEPADRRARAALAKMEERDDRETIEVEFHPPVKRALSSIGNSPYAVAPAPQPGERACAASEQLAAPDLHTVTVSELLDAIELTLADLDVSAQVRAEAEGWVDGVRASIDDGGRTGAGHRDDATHALARAAVLALGLAAPGGAPEAARGTPEAAADAPEAAASAPEAAASAPEAAASAPEAAASAPEAAADAPEAAASAPEG